MSTPFRSDERAAILDDFAAAFDYSPTHAELSLWIERYPQYARDLTEFAAHWSLVEIFAPEDEPAAPDPARIARDLAIVQRLRRELAPPITSLVAEARQIGQQPMDITAQAGISMTLLAKLDRRLIRAATIPTRLIDNLAAAIDRGADAVRIYLQGGATLPSGAMYRATAAPRLQEGEAGEDFFAAVANDMTLAPEARDAWLALAPPADPAS